MQIPVCKNMFLYMKLEIKMKKSGLLIRAAIPVFALLGVLAPKSEVQAYAEGKRVFKWVDVQTDVNIGYRNDQLKFENRATSTWADVFTGDLYGTGPFSAIGAIDQPFVSQEFVRTRQDLIQARTKTTIAAVDGALTNSFLEMMADMAFPVSEHKIYHGHGIHDGAGDEFGNNRPRFRFDNSGHGHHHNHDHIHHNGHHDGHNGKSHISGNARAFDAHVIVGYDIAKLKNPWKDFAFKPFAGYYWMRQKSSKNNIRGFHRPDVHSLAPGSANNSVGTSVPVSYLTQGYPSRATVETSAKWHGWFGGFIAESTWGDHTLWVRPEYRGVHTSRFWTQTRIHNVTAKNHVKSKRGKNGYGYNLGGGYKYRIDPDWVLHLDGAWTTMISKRPRHKERTFVSRTDKATLRSYNFNLGVGFNY
jgi:hypothetical protein